MDDRNVLVVAERRQPPDIQHHRERVLGRRRKREPDPALGLEFADEPAALRGDEGARAGMGEARRDVDGRALGAAGLEFGDNLQDRSGPRADETRWTGTPPRRRVAPRKSPG